VTAWRARDWPWVVALVLLASVTGETIASPNTPPLTYIRSPAALPFFVVTYGLWALLFREAWARGRLGWAGAIIAGIGYTAFNEGLIAQTWFRPAVFGFTAFRLGRVAGVNWCIVVGLCIFHIVFSMALPITVIQLGRGERKRRPWLRRRGIIVCSGCLLVLMILIVSNAAVRSSPHRLAAATIALVLPLVAVSVPALGWPARPSTSTLPERSAAGRGPRRRGAYGFGLGWAVAFYLSFYGAPALIGVAAVVVEAAVAAVGLRYLMSRPAGAPWSSAHWVALIAGALTPALAFELFDIRPLETVTVVLAVVALVLLDRRFRAELTVNSPDADRSQPAT
jgi:hypothetical protein